jgi:hypothetical protein
MTAVIKIMAFKLIKNLDIKNTIAKDFKNSKKVIIFAPSLRNLKEMKEIKVACELTVAKRIKAC